jgi:hypothetical protein
MKPVRKVTAALATLMLTMAIYGTARASRAQKDSEAQKPASKTPEMDRLKFYLGEWDYTETYAKSGEYPNGSKNTGLYTSKLGPGGNSLINSFHSQGPAGDFEALLVMTWDAKEKAYKEYVFSDFPGAIVETGQFDGDALVFRAEFSEGGTTVKTRNVARLTRPGKMVIEEYSALKDGQEKLFVTVDATKHR